MNALKNPKPISFWKLYGLVMAVDLILYVLVFYAGRGIPSAPGASSPGNYGLMLHWLDAHRPAALIFYESRALPDSLMWLLIFQDAWVAGLAYWLVRTTSRSRPADTSRPRDTVGQK